MSHTSAGPHAPWYQPQRPGQWDHRKAEWSCSACSRRNFLSRGTCRDCGKPYAKSKDTVFPEGSPPPPRTAQPQRGGQGASSKATFSPDTDDPVKLAEAAVAAATKSGAGEQVLCQLKEDLEARQKDEATRAAQKAAAEQPRLTTETAKRLQAATVKVTQAESVYSKAAEKLTTAQTAAAEAQAALTAARQEVDSLTAEIAKSRPPPPELASDMANTHESALSALLRAVKEAAQDAPGARDKLEQAAADAEAALKPPPPSAHSEPRPDASLAEEATEAAPIATAAAAEQKRQQEADLDTRALEMLEALEQDTSPEQKRSRLREALRQEWGAPAGPAWAATQA